MLSRTWEKVMTSRKIQLSRIPLSAIDRLLKRDEIAMPGNGKRRAAKPVKPKTAKTVRSRGA